MKTFQNFNPKQALKALSGWGYLFESKISVIIRRSLLISSALLILCSCEQEYKIKDTRTGRLEFEGHSYIRLIYSGTHTIIHDPDCKCKEKE